MEAFLSWGSLLSDDSSLCQVDIKLASIKPGPVLTAELSLQTPENFLTVHLLCSTPQRFGFYDLRKDEQMSGLINISVFIYSFIYFCGSGRWTQASHSCQVDVLVLNYIAVLACGAFIPSWDYWPAQVTSGERIKVFGSLIVSDASHQI